MAETFAFNADIQQLMSSFAIRSRTPAAAGVGFDSDNESHSGSNKDDNKNNAAPTSKSRQAAPKLVSKPCEVASSGLEMQ